MQYCRLHNEKRYSPEQVEEITFCAYAGLYQDIHSGRIAAYCFADLDKNQTEKLCAERKEEKE